MKKLLSIILAVLMIVTIVPLAFAAEDYKTVYFKNTGNWTNVNIYYWFFDAGQGTETMTTWPGDAMTDAGDGVWSYDIPDEANYVIFNNGSTQTDDLTLPADGKNLYDYSADAWSTYSAPEEDTADYYLVGYINGANYGYEEDWENFGEYKFVDGKLTATFDSDSYVLIKDRENSAWYYTQSYSMEQTVTLYNYNTYPDCFEKLYVPADRMLEFTLIVNGDDTLTLSYSIVASACSHTGGKVTCTDKAVCGLCGEEYGDVDENAHDWSNKDGICVNGCGAICEHGNYTDGKCIVCGYECPHESYTKGKCDACEYPCLHSFTVFNETVAPKCEESGWEESYCDYGCGIKLEQEIPTLEHAWVSGGVERPAQNIDGSWSDGYYYDTCKNDATHINITGVAKRGDYDTFNALLAQVKGYQTNAVLIDEAVAKANKVINSNWMFVAGYIPQNLIENELNVYIGQLKPVAEVIEAGIADGTMLKADYTEIDKAIAEIEEKLASENVTDEGKAGLEEIKAQLTEMKADGNTSEADLAELEKALEDYEAEINAGIEDGTLVEVDTDKISDEANKKWAEKLESEGLMDEYEDFIYGQKLTDEALAALNEMDNFLFSLEGTVAENAENIAKYNEMVDAFIESWENCLRGTHNFDDYEITTPAKCEVNAKETGTCWFCGETDERDVDGSALDHIFLEYASNGDATCTADGTKTATCLNGCGATDTVADEDSILDHADEDGDSLCDGCGEGLTCKDCGRKAHEDKGIAQYICLIITFIRLVVSFFNSVK